MEGAELQSLELLGPAERLKDATAMGIESECPVFFGSCRSKLVGGLEHVCPYIGNTNPN